MPIYEYRCVGCGYRLELLQRKGDPTPTVCSECGGALERMFSASVGIATHSTHAAAPEDGAASCCGLTSPCDNPKRCCGQE